jgi:hypothetical protein
MRGPMGDAIKRPEATQDKARKRLEEFIDQRYPGGVPPAGSPVEKQPPTSQMRSRSVPKNQSQAENSNPFSSPPLH